MAELVYFSKIVEKYGAFADFVVIYIEEAHPKDGWRFPDNYDIKKHQTLKERLNAASRLLEHNILPTSVPILVDSIEDETNKAYAGLFERIYIIQSNKIAYQGGLGPWKYSLEDLEQQLLLYSGSK